MHLEALGIFCDVVRHQSFSRAAAANAMSQSAASQAVRQIENRLGAQLIDRSMRPWRLTSEGKLFFQGCQELVERYHELEDAVRRRQQPAGYTVRVASIYSIRLHDLSEYVDRFNRLAPGAAVEIEYMHPDPRVRAHPQRPVGHRPDLVRQPGPRPRPDGDPVARPDDGSGVPPRPAASRGCTREQRGVHPRDLAREPFVTFESRAGGAGARFDRFLRRHEVDVAVAAEFDNIENIKQAVEDGAVASRSCRRTPYARRCAGARWSACRSACRPAARCRSGRSASSTAGSAA